MKALILDTETTGLINNHSIALDRQPEVIEFYACIADLKTGKVGKKLHTLIKPSKYPMSPKVIEETKTKITNDMLRSAPPFAKVAGEIKKMVEAAPVVIAHNVSFDREMLDIEYERLDQTLQWPRCICTVEQTIHIKGYRLSLTNLHIQLFDRAFKEAHRAEADVGALRKCCVELFKRGML